jgi:hypothetical protein
MKRKNTRLAALTCAAFVGTAALSQAAVIIADDFSYTDGSLNGQNGGTGFSGAWSSNSNVSGGAAATVGANSTATRSFSSAFASTGTIWISFDWGYDSTPANGNSYGGLTFYTGGTENFLIGNTWPDPSPHNVWSINGAAVSSESNVGMKTAVARIQLGTGAASTVDLWVGGTGSPVDVSGAALLTSTGLDLDGVDGIRILGYSGNGANQGFDNLVIGTTMADVDAVPETSTALLGGIGLLALLRRRR